VGAAPRLRPDLVVPSILFEPDNVDQNTGSGPGERFALGTPFAGLGETSTPLRMPNTLPVDAPTPSLAGNARFISGLQQTLRPGSAGILANPKTVSRNTPAGRDAGAPERGRPVEDRWNLWLQARDPHWLHAHWDLDPQAMQAAEAQAESGRLTLTVFEEGANSTPPVVATLDRGAAAWFVHVERSGTRFVAELGFVTPGGVWHSLARSAPACTPSNGESAAGDEALRFATIPVDAPLTPALVASTVARPVSPAGYPNRARSGVLPTAAPAWTTAQHRALAEVARLGVAQRVWVGSLDLTELVRQRLGWDAANLEHGHAPGGSSPAVAFGVSDSVPVPTSGISSPTDVAGVPSERHDFWLDVNAELVLYGATQPDATLTVGGRPVPLGPDGKFSLRFALPDGEYRLPVQAVARTGDDVRQVTLEFRRRSEYDGEVGVHPQDSRLKSPEAFGVGGATGAAAPGSA
jgi:hypothetical protein